MTLLILYLCTRCFQNFLEGMYVHCQKLSLVSANFHHNTTNAVYSKNLYRIWKFFTSISILPTRSRSSEKAKTEKLPEWTPYRVKSVSSSHRAFSAKHGIRFHKRQQPVNSVMHQIVILHIRITGYQHLIDHYDPRFGHRGISAFHNGFFYRNDLVQFGITSFSENVESVPNVNIFCENCVSARGEKKPSAHLIMSNFDRWK